MRLLPSLMAASLAALASQGLQAQVVISEVSFETPGWIELRNNGSTEVDLSKWSIYQATKTANRSGNYWFGLPAGTKIKSKDYIRVIWGGAIQTPNDPRDIYTGDKYYNFMFGHGFEKLDPKSGAIGVLNTQSNTQMNSVGIVVDWMQWGETGFKRENLATSSSPQIWAANTKLDAGEADMSFALLYNKDALPTPTTAFFSDYSPTPLGHNADSYGVSSDLTACGFGNYGPLSLKVNSDPIHGNKDFALIIEGTKGPAFFETASQIFRFDHNTATLPTWWCDRISWNNGGNFWMTPFFATSSIRTEFKVPLLVAPALGMKAQTQTLTFSSNSWRFSNRLFIEVSN